MSARVTNRAWLQVVGLTAVFGCGLLQTVSAQDDLYSTVDLGLAVAEHISLARRINIQGQVVGRTGSVAGTDTRAAVWTLGELRVLGALPGGDYSGAFGINDSGVVVGSSNTATILRPFIWSSGSGMRALPSLPGHKGGEA